MSVFIKSNILAGKSCYWDAIANSYDRYYEGPYSQCEDDAVSALMSTIFCSLPDGPILDLAAGTGLAVKLIPRQYQDRYTALDLSLPMLTTLTKRRRLYRSVCGDIDYLPFSSSSISAVTCISGSASFCSDISRFLQEVKRVLVPDGKYLIGALSRTSLRRILRLRVGSNEAYMCRGVPENYGFIQAKVYTLRQLDTAMRKSGLTPTIRAGIAAFGGVLEHPRIWPIDVMISSISPGLAHIAYVGGRKA